MTGSARHCLSGIPRPQEREAIVQDHRKPLVRGVSVSWTGGSHTTQGLMDRHTQFSNTVLPSKLPYREPRTAVLPKAKALGLKSTNKLTVSGQAASTIGKAFLGWSSHSLDSGPEMGKGLWCKEMNCPTTK